MTWCLSGPFKGKDQDYKGHWWRHVKGDVWWFAGRSVLPAKRPPPGLGVPDVWRTEGADTCLGVSPGGDYYIAIDRPDIPEFSKISKPTSLVEGMEVFSPPHYTHSGVEPFDAIEAWQKTWPPEIRYHLGASVKYLARLGAKEGADVTTDLRKAATYIARALQVLEGQKGQTKGKATDG